ncbi:MAG: hypothetical protein WCO11_08160 [Sphingomonadales bacterium]|jgi:hypothetical protein
MNLLVSDNQYERHQKIRSLLQTDTANFAVLAAAMDFEWTIRRIFDHAQFSKPINKPPPKLSSLYTYASTWKEFFPSDKHAAMDEIPSDWKELVSAYHLRHDIVHGRQGTVGVEYARSRVEIMISASIALTEYGRKMGFDPFRRLRKRGHLTGPTPR